MMRRLLLLFIPLLLFLPVSNVAGQAPAPKRIEEPKTETVYITRTGKKYHRAGCRYLAHSAIKVSLKDAKANGYTPCKVCRPAE